MNRWERVASIAAGAALLALAARKHGTGPRVAKTAGAGLVARGLGGYCPINAATGRGQRRDDTRQALGGSRGVFVQERITIDAPIESLYAFWRNPANLPTVMPFLERVDRLDDRRSHWVVAGPAGTTVEWDAEVINEVPGETIGWQSLPGADVASAGSVRFRPARRGGTEITVTMQYAPPAGKAGAVVARLFGRSPAVEIRQALQHLKGVMESAPATSG